MKSDWHMYFAGWRTFMVCYGKKTNVIIYLGEQT